MCTHRHTATWTWAGRIPIFEKGYILGTYFRKRAYFLNQNKDVERLPHTQRKTHLILPVTPSQRAHIDAHAYMHRKTNTYAPTHISFWPWAAKNKPSKRARTYIQTYSQMHTSHSDLGLPKLAPASARAHTQTHNTCKQTLIHTHLILSLGC